MKIIWSVNVITKGAGEAIGQKAEASVTWLDHLSSKLKEQVELVIIVPMHELYGQHFKISDCTPEMAERIEIIPVNTKITDLGYDEIVSTKKDQIRYYYLPRKSFNGFDYEEEMSFLYETVLEREKPDLIHIHGTEFPATLSIVEAAERLELIDKTVVSIQGIITEIAKAFCGGVPKKLEQAYSLKDYLRHNNLKHYQAWLAKRGEYEVLALKQVKHVIGRTSWDRTHLFEINPSLTYHYNSETMRTAFYEGRWKTEEMDPHRIFMSQGGLPYKGMHYALEALGELVVDYPDLELYITGRNLGKGASLKDLLRFSAYELYLRKMLRKKKLWNRVFFLGSLNAEQMKEQYLKANVFILPSTVENSPNSLGEAMLLGVPIVAADVGGVKDLMRAGMEGESYPCYESGALAAAIRRVFECSGETLEKRGSQKSAHARLLYDPEKNLADLLDIYQKLTKKQL